MLDFLVENRLRQIIGTVVFTCCYITDIGMIGPQDSVIGLDKKIIIQNYLTDKTKSADVPKTGPCLINAVYLEIDPQTAKAKKIKRINKTIQI